MLNIRTALELPDDINAIEAYWSAITDEEREVHKFLFKPESHDMFFKMIRLNMEASMAKDQLPPECKAEVRRELEKPKKAKEPETKTVVIESKDYKSKFGVMAPYPTQLARCNPFLPIRNIKQNEILDLTLADGSWGTINYHGPPLTMSHEDVLVVVLALIFSCGKGRRVKDVANGRNSYVYVGSKREILRARGEANPNKNSYNDLDKMILDMATAAVIFVAKDSSAKAIDNLVSYIEDKDGKIVIRINSYFAAAYEQELITWVSLRERMKIETLSGRALHRFISSHRGGEWYGSLSVLSNAINIPQSLPLYKKRDKIKKAVSEMISIGILKKGSSVSGNKVTLFKAKTTSNRVKKMLCGQNAI